MTCFATVKDLRNWVWEHAGDNLNAQDIDAITEAIRSDLAFPPWGQDCSDFLASLPSLVELL
jgi:hypothetical protein